MPSATQEQLSHDSLERRRPLTRGEPAWDVALLYPSQGSWTEQEYLSLGTNCMVEFDDGCIEVLPMPTWSHQLLVRWLFYRLSDFVRAGNLGEVMFAPLPVRLWAGKYREPDLMFVSRARAMSVVRYPDGLDLAIEVVSEGSDARTRDLEVKRTEYASARIQEYWIVDPQLRQITVLMLDGEEYRVHGVFEGEALLTSPLLAGFSFRASDAFAVAEREGNAE